MLTIEQTAKELGLKESTVMTYISNSKRLEKVIVDGTTYVSKESIENYKEFKKYRPNQKTEYAIYKGDDFIDIGTPKELSEKLGIKESTIEYYGTNTHHKRVGTEGTVAIKI